MPSAFHRTTAAQAPTGPFTVIDIASIQTARENLRGQVLKTPFTLSRTLSDIFGAEIWLKFENLQFTASFKERGALNRMLTLSEAERAKGVIAVSAGNHAQGVAYHAQRMGVPAVIVMPRFTPTVKVANTRRFGAEVVLAGDTFDDAKARGYELAQERGLIMIHPTTTRPSSRGRARWDWRCWKTSRSWTRWPWPSAAAA